MPTGSVMTVQLTPPSPPATASAASPSGQVIGGGPRVCDLCVVLSSRTDPKTIASKGAGEREIDF